METLFDNEMDRAEYFAKEIIPLIALDYDVSQPNLKVTPHCYKVIDTPMGNITIYTKSGKIQTAEGWITENTEEWLRKNIIKEC